MKFIVMFFLVTFSLILNPLYSQEVLLSGELVIIMEDNNEEYEFRMTLTSPLCFDADGSDDDLHNISSEYNSAVVFADEYAQFYLTGLWGPPLANDFGLGKYRVSIIKNQAIIKYFDIDYRSSDLIENFNCCGNLNGDIFLDYDVSTNKLYYQYTQNEFPSVTTIWDEKEWIQHLTTEFEPLPPENLYWYDFYDHPRLQWSHSSNSGDYVTNYQIYRDQGEGWELISTQSAALVYFVDYEIDLEGPPVPEYLYYKVRAKNGSRTSDEFSNTVKVAGPDDFGKGSNNYLSDETKFQYYLEQNFPNPFNPTTTINYSIQTAGEVTLKVYDMLGTEIASLVNERLEAGNYIVEFNASDLPSGIYVYILKSGNFVDGKKLILLK